MLTERRVGVGSGRVIALGLLVIVASVLSYVVGSLTVARRTRLAGGHWSRPETAPPDIPRWIPLLVLLSYPGLVIGVVVLVVGLL